MLKKQQNGVLFNKMLNVILSTTGSDINVDFSWWAQILQWVVMKFTHENLLCIKMLSVCECITLIINTALSLFWCWNVNGHVENSNFYVIFWSKKTMLKHRQNLDVFSMLK